MSIMEVLNTALKKSTSLIACIHSQITRTNHLAPQGMTLSDAIVDLPICHWTLFCLAISTMVMFLSLLWQVLWYPEWHPVSVREFILPCVPPVYLLHSAFLYSDLSLIWVVSASDVVGILQWYFWGYSFWQQSRSSGEFANDYVSWCHRARCGSDGSARINARHDRCRWWPAKFREPCAEGSTVLCAYWWPEPRCYRKCVGLRRPGFARVTIIGYGLGTSLMLL